MRNQLLTGSVTLVATLFAAVGTAQNVSLEPAASPSLNRFGLSYRIGYKISAEFRNLGGFSAQTDPGLPTSGIDHNYDDGYNRVDIAGNDHTVGEMDGRHLTWYWGYESSSQVDTLNDTIVMHSSSSPGGAVSRNVDDSPHPGFELTYNRQLGKAGRGTWGMEAAFNYLDIKIQDTRRLVGSVSRINDAYDLGGITPPGAPYHGTFEGPTLDQPFRPVISDIPMRTVTLFPGATAISGPRRLDADLYGFRVGPYWEIPAAKRVNFSVSAGLTVVSVESNFRFRETVTIPGLGNVTQSGAGSDNDVLIGGYVSGVFSYAITESVSFLLGAQYQNIGDYTHKENGKKAELHLGDSIFLTAGLGFSF